MTSRTNTLLDQGIHCITILAIGIANAPFIPHDLRLKLIPFILIVLVPVLIVYLYLNTKRSKDDIAREQRDERSRMIQEKAVWYCRITEDWVLLGLFVWFGVFRLQTDIAFTIWWLLLGRDLLTFGIRWWMNRKY